MKSVSLCEPPRVLLIDDSNAVRERLRSLIDEDGRCHVVGEATDQSQARILFSQTQPDAVVLDLHLGESTTFGLMAEFRRNRPTCSIVVLTQYSEPGYRERCEEQGANHFLIKGSDFERVAPLLAQRPAPGSTTAAPWQELSGPEAKAIIEGLAVAVYVCDSQGRIVLYNAAAAQLWGREPDRTRDRWCGAWRVCAADGQPLPSEGLPLRKLAAAPHAPARCELVFERPDGTRRCVLCEARVHLDAHGAVSAVVGVLTDVTAVRQAERDRREAELLVKRVLDASRSSLWDLDLTTGRVRLSENWSEMMGGARVATVIEFEQLAACVPEPDRLRVAAAMRPALKGEVDAYAVEHGFLTPAGELMWLLSEGRVIERDANGRALRAVGTNRDITTQVGAQRALRQSEAQLRRLIDNLAAGVLVYGIDGSIVLSNVHAQQLLKLPLRRTPERAMADPGLEFVHEDGHVLGAAEHPLRRVLGSGAPLRNQVLGIRLAASDDTMWAIVNAFPAFDEQRRIEQVVLSFVDITDRRHAELALRRSEGRLRALVELSSDWLWEQDESLRFTLVSDNGDDHAGLAASEHLGKTRWELPHVDMSEAVWAEHRDRLARREVFRDFEITRRDHHGTLRTALISGMPVFDDGGRFAGYRGISRDVTAQRAADEALRALEMQLLESQRMESIGTLAGGIAHDFNGIVAAILANAKMARDALEGGSAAQEPLARIVTACRRARTLVQQIMAFARREPQVLLSQPLLPVVQETLALFRSCLPVTASLHTDTDAGESIHVMADATQIQQVLMNLCSNALHAFEHHSGRIDVGIDVVVLGRADAQPLEVGPGHYARMWVRDNGRGMDDEVRARIFEPLFTTKPAGQGTGLGLSVVRRIMASHGGAVTAHSEPGRGATFEVYLPLADPDSGLAPLQIDTVPGQLRSAGHVLVVDDDEVVQLTVVCLLEQQGLRVSACANANDALAAVRAEPADFDLVVTDFNLSVMSGLDMARNLALIRRDLPVLIISGLVTDELRAQASEADVRSVLDKGALGRELVQAVRQALRPARTLGRTAAWGSPPANRHPPFQDGHSAE